MYLANIICRIHIYTLLRYGLEKMYILQYTMGLNNTLTRLQGHTGRYAQNNGISLVFFGYPCSKQ